MYPNDAIGEVHADGEIWSQPLYELANAMGRDAVTKIILQSHWSLTPNASFNDGARAIKQADKLLNRGKNGKLIDRIFNARGYLQNNECIKKEPAGSFLIKMCWSVADDAVLGL